ncbi:ribosomal RNA processing protein 1 homolog B-like isoform X2 [Channa argus]|uniref:ribosomal RNA processing protein 1 homolog B-like isoform X2 n=1 Tax=Channa argus TaxID=215402 RepID=UPI003521479C
MASIQEPEVQFAQRLASNEKSVRTKAIRKLRKYISVRSQKGTGGFTGDELLKLWKGLFYCLWMQDKPLLQEELSNQISSLIHRFHDFDGQLLYLETFLQTFKREWTGIDRLRMDKFFQLIRFMFRQTFEMLKGKNWQSSLIEGFLELLKVQLLQSGSSAPSGLQFHILDLYMTELAAVGSAELTADQNLIFIEPFCKTAAKTKDRNLFRAICSSIFSTIIDQAPFAIEDLMREVKAAEDLDSDSGEASVKGDGDQLKENMSNSLIKKGKQVNGIKLNEQEEEDDEDDEDDNDLGDLEDSDTELPHDEDDDAGPVLQFDYAALANKLFELASRSSSPNHNRQKLYRIIKVLRDLSEGIFPQDEYPEEVSTDEDDDLFGSRKRMKRPKAHVEENEQGAPPAKKSKVKKNDSSTLNKQKNHCGKEDDQEDLSTNDEKKKRKKKKKAGQGQSACDEDGAEKSYQGQSVAQKTVNDTEEGLECLDKQSQSSISSVKVTEAVTPPGRLKTLLSSELKEQASVTTIKDKSYNTLLSNKKKKRNTFELKPMVTAMEQQTTATTELEVPPEATAPVSVKKKKRKGLRADSLTDAEAEITLVGCEASQEKSTTTTPAKEKTRVKADRNLTENEGESHTSGLSSEADVMSVHFGECERPNDTRTPVKKRSKKKSLRANEALEVVVEGKWTDAELTHEASQQTAAVPLNEKMKRKGKQKEKMHRDKEARDETSEDTTLVAAAGDSTVPSLKKKRKTNKKKFDITANDEEKVTETPLMLDAERVLFEITMTTPAKAKKKSPELSAFQTNEIKKESQLQMVGSVDADLALDEQDVAPSYKKQSKKKKKKIPVVFEFEADELGAATEKEAGAKETAAGNNVAEPSTPLNIKKSRKKAKTSSGSASDFITFQGNASFPTPLFCKTQKSPRTPLISKKKIHIPNSESKKVTFGLKNNKTAEFRKTDRSLLVSPDGSSRVAFDPKQKPKFGVLKSPPTPFPKVKMSLKTPKNTPKRRPSAADFF